MKKDLPQGWTIAQLPDLADVNPPLSTNVSDATPVSFIPMRAIEELSGRLNSQVSRLWGEVKRGYTRFEECDVVMAKITPSMENGKVAIAANLLNGVAAGTTELHVLRPRGDVDGRYIMHYLLQESVRRRARARMTGTAGQLRVPTAFLEEEELPVAPEAEQARICESIESHLSRLDAATVELAQVQAKLSAYRASVLKAAVEGRLVFTEAEVAGAENREYETADVLLQRILVERRRRWEETELARLKAAGKRPKDNNWKAKYKEPVAPKADAFPPLPEGWCWATVDQLFSKITSGSRDWTEYYNRGDGVFILAQNVRPGKLDLTLKQLVDPPSRDSSVNRSRVQREDILVTIVGANTGQVCRVDADFDNHFVCQSVALMRPVANDTSRFISWHLNSPAGQQAFRNFIYGQGRPHLSFDNLRETVIPIAPLPEQQRICEAVENHVSNADNTEVAALGSRIRIARLRQSILKWAFEGKLVDQDPNDEPAEKLLERIRAERAARKPAKKPARRRKKKATK